MAVLQGPFPPPPPPSAASAIVVGGGVQTSSPLTAPEYRASASPGEDKAGSFVGFAAALVLFFAAAASFAAAAAAVDAESSRRRRASQVSGVLAVEAALRRTDSIPARTAGHPKLGCRMQSVCFLAKETCTLGTWKLQ